MQPVELGHSARPLPASFDGTLRLALLVSFPVIGLHQFLHTSPAALLASPLDQSLRWVSDALLALPLAAAAIWAGHRIASRSGPGPDRVWDVFACSCAIALLLALLLAPVWFGHDETSGLTRSQAVVPAHSHDHGAVNGAGGGLLYALVAVPLAAVALWAGYWITSRFRLWRPRAADVFACLSVIVPLLAIALAAAWLLLQAAGEAAASQVNYTSALLSVHVHSHAFFAHTPLSRVPAGPRVTGTPFAFAYQVAHAVQDGLAGQAIGLPVTFMALLWRTRGQRGRSGSDSQVSNEGTENELVQPIEPPRFA